MNKLSPIKFSQLDYFIILVYGVVASVSFILDNKIIYILLGSITLFYYTYNILKKPEFVISLLVAVGHPFSLTFGRSEIPLISAISIIFCFSFAILVDINKHRNLILSKYKIRFLLILTVFLFFLFVKLVQGDYNSVGISQFISFLGFGYIECVTVVILCKNIDDIVRIIKPCIFFFVSYTIAFFIIFIYNKFDIAVLDKLENPIGISYFLFINCLFSWFVLTKNTTLKIISISLAVSLCIILGQRSFMVGGVILAIILMIKYNYIKQLLWGIAVVVILCIYSFNRFYNGANYKLNLLMKFFEHPSEYINGISGFSFSEAHDAIGTIGSRLYMWYISVTETDPLYGKGLGTFSNLMEDPALSYPHNIIFEAFYLFGWVGLITITLYLFVTLKKSYNSIRRGCSANWIPLSIILLFIILLFSSSITGLFSYYIIFSYMLSLVRPLKTNKK